MIKGDLETIKVFDLTRVSITHPEVADMASVDSEHILMLGKQPGQTTVFIWDKYGKRSVLVRVADDDLDAVKSRIQRMIGEAGIQGISLDINKLEGKLVLSGALTKDQREIFNKLIEPFSASIMNLVKEKSEDDLIQIDAQISELNSSYSKSMGFDWTSALTYTETLPAFNPSAPTDFLKVGDFSRTTQILAVVDALITEGKGRILSKPKLVCMSGKEASFLVGGEIPVTTTTTSSGGNVSEDVEFREYGVTLNVKPTIRDEKIDIDLSLEVSDIDAANKVGDNVAFTTRNTKTQLYLENGQTVVLAGLIKQSEGKTVKRIPILSSIPVFGAIFRHSETPLANTDTELIISLKPTILTQHNKSVQNDYSVTTTEAAAEEELPTPRVVKSASKSYVAGDSMAAKTLIPEDMVPYVRVIQNRIAQSIAYPEQARKYGWQGTVKLALHILNDGTLTNVALRESSGYDLFDEDAVTTAKNLAPYSAFPSNLDLQDMTVTIPIVYSLDSK